MQLSKSLIILAAVFGVTMSTPSVEALVKKPPTKIAASKSAKKASKKASKKKVAAKSAKKLKTNKKIPFILAPKTTEALTTETPHQHHFSPEFIDSLARGDMHQAYNHLQLEEASDKVGYMINQVLMAQGKGASHGGSVSPFDRATAWHNLYLFLANQGRPAPKFVKEAAKYYQKSARKAPYTNKANILLAALYATNGSTVQSEKYFSKVDIPTLTHTDADYNGLEYLATYYAAIKQTQKAIDTLDLAYKLNPGSLLQWLHVGDDFWTIKEEPVFQEQVTHWQVRHKQMLAQLQQDKTTHGARKKAALESRLKKKQGKSAKKPSKSGKSGKKKRR